MIEFFVTYFLLLLFASFTILGWYKISREGMLFQFWSKFWEGKNGTKKNYTEGEKLYKEYRMIEQSGIQNGFKGTIKYYDKYLEADKEFESIKSKVEHDLLIHLETKEVGEGLQVLVYEEELVFRFPEWVRNPISSCPTCQSSVYGSIIFWTFIFLVERNLFHWASHEKIALILTWIAFEFSLAFLNTFIHSKTN